MEWRIEVVFVPVSNVDRAKAFYRDAVGFHEDFDTRFTDDLRMVQLTPPGSGCSIALMSGAAAGRPGPPDIEPGSLQGLMVVVDDLTAARERLLEHGVEVSEILEVVHEEGGSVYRPVAGEP
ncbi:MAG TPA: VOC family protein, partial [Actinomycetota bacterium]